MIFFFDSTVECTENVFRLTRRGTIMLATAEVLGKYWQIMQFITLKRW